ncbi:MAG: polyhydroxyalkanoate synthesis repressor PhaR [Alphaproteobacteria bacterium]|jgi:polyhydroxyalkanoate synthesis repressor PhaR|nr:polyhydroxyalkanoate synthesis repressor PhaR [Rhodospirillaceae bacterium]MDG2480302.1 polyhydroxyalkanoate synthesis repressor PhaR [Alphaproteobacteria bacterium]MBT6205335.1 polyhydroxyalkanoate synthesis repressor PhaR [Rhodospirillaceae bacterium]MBT6510225.1 polyhydroxyalkanoate synthesis repressor PhaR [Rhodospirillaceae bacterium]MBT7613128.1 polyhydroxyalkanoate synthesis repressor PhaR [Rhodospirillaceae bacterium]
MARKNNQKDGDTVVIKKYANRRLYNTATSSYVTLDHLAQMVKDGVEFVVFDAKSGDDITRSVLTQIIVEEEAKGANLLPISFLRQLIGFYGDSLQTFVPRYLEMSMENLATNQEKVRDMMSQSFGQMFPFSNPEAGGAVEDMVKNNMVMFQRAMEMFYPGGGVAPDGTSTGSGNGNGADHPEASAGAGGNRNDLDTLKDQIDSLQKQLNDIARRG